MDYLILAANLLVVVYSALVHSKRDDTPVEHPIRMILILSILAGVIQIGDILDKDWSTHFDSHYMLQIAILLATGKLVHFLYHLQISSSNDRRKESKSRGGEGPPEAS